MNRIEKKFKELKEKREKALVAFITAGDPSLKETEKLIFTLEKSGVDIIELGVPFSDPMADGPVIQLSSERALLKGTNLKNILEMVSRVRKKTDIPILLMGYYNPIFNYGTQKFSKDAARAGVDAALVVDLPIEESDELTQDLSPHGLDLIFLVSPVTGKNRQIQIAKKASGFIYFVSMTGVTGAKLSALDNVKSQVQQLKQKTKVPVCIGFGISDPKQAKKMAQLGDGVVIGSKIIQIIQDNLKKDYHREVFKFLSSIKSAIH